MTKREEAIIAIGDLTGWTRARCEKVLDDLRIRKYYAKIMRKKCSSCRGVQYYFVRCVTCGGSGYKENP